MAVGDVFSIAPTSVAAGATLNVQPASGTEAVIHNLYYGGQVQLLWTDGTNTIAFYSDATAGSLLNTTLHVTNGKYLQIKNTGSAAIYVAYDGIQTGINASALNEAAAAQLINGGLGGADHFLGTTLGTQWISEASAATYVVGNSSLGITVGANLTNHVLRSYAPTGAFRVEARLAVPAANASCSAGLMVRDSGTGDASGNGVLVHIGASSNVIQFYLLSAGAYTQQGSSYSINGAYSYLYLRLDRNASNQFNAYWSLDRSNWQQVGTANAALTFTAAKLGLRTSSSAAGVTAVAACDFIDVVS